MTMTWLRRTSDWIAGREPLVLLFLTPWLLSPRMAPRLTLAALLLLPALWIIRILAGRPVSVSTPLNAPILLLLVGMAPAAWYSPLPAQSLPYATVMLLGASWFFALVNCDARWRTLDVWARILTGLGFLIAVIALFVTQWPSHKIRFLDTIGASLPTLLSQGGLDPAVVGGTLAFLLPVVIGTARLGWMRGKRPLMGHWQAWTWLSVAVAVLMLAIVALSQSRTAMLVALIILGFRLGRRQRLAATLMTAVMITVLALLLIGLVSGNLGRWMPALDSWTRSAGFPATSWTDRAEVWANAVPAIRDYPLTGVGLDAFGPVAWLNYAFPTSDPAGYLLDAHNLWLQAGVDQGVVGFLAFLWLSLIMLLFGWVIQRRRDPENRLLLESMWFGLFAWLLFGSLNVIALGTAPAVLIWILIGLIAGTWRTDEGQNGLAPRKLVWWPWLVGALVIAMLLATLPHSSPWMLNRGASTLDNALLRGNEQRIETALDYLEQAEELPGSLRRRAIAAYEMGDRETAETLFIQDEGAATYLYSRSRLLIETGEMEKAQDVALLGLAVSPASGRLACVLGVAYQQDGNPTVALQYYRLIPQLAASFESYPNELAVCLQDLSVLEGSLGWWHEAAEHLAFASRLEPSNTDLVLARAWAMYQASGELSEAVSLVEELYDANPEALDPVLLLADMYLDAGRGQKGYEWSEVGLELAPSDPEVWLRLAQALHLLDRQGEAQQALTEALRLQPDHPLALQLVAAWGDAGTE